MGKLNILIKMLLSLCLGTALTFHVKGLASAWRADKLHLIKQHQVQFQPFRKVEKLSNPSRLALQNKL